MKYVLIGPNNEVVFKDAGPDVCLFLMEQPIAEWLVYRRMDIETTTDINSVINQVIFTDRVERHTLELLAEHASPTL